MTSFAPYDPSMGITSDQYYQWKSAADPMSDTYNSSYTGPKPSVSFPKREFGNPDRGGLVSLLDQTGEIGRRSEFDPGRTGFDPRSMRGGLVSLLDPTGEIGRRPADVMSLIGMVASNGMGANDQEPRSIPGTGGGFPLPPGYEGSQKPSSRLGEEFSGKGTSTLLGQTDMVRKEYVGIPWGPEVIDHGPRRIPVGNGTRPERMPYFKHPNPFPQPSVIPDWQKKGPEHGIKTTLESILKIL